MKRFFALALVLVTVCVLFCACGKNAGTVTTTVNSKYDDGFADKYANSTSTDEDGNKVYEFSGSQYDDYTTSHKNSLAKELTSEIAANHEEGYGEYVYINTDTNSVMIGIHEGEYDAETAADEAAEAAEYGFKYFQNLQTPVDFIKVVYCNAGNQSVVYGSFDFTAD